MIGDIEIDRLAAPVYLDDPHPFLGLQPMVVGSDQQHWHAEASRRLGDLRLDGASIGIDNNRRTCVINRTSPQFS